MKFITALILVGFLFNCGHKNANDPVDYYDRFDLANTIDTTRGTYNPKVDSTYIFPADSADIVTYIDTIGYKIKTIIFPVRNKYITMFHETLNRIEKVRYRDFKLQIEITNYDDLYIKKVVSKYDLPDSVIAPHYFIQKVELNQIETGEFVFDIKFICYGDDGCFPPNVKCYVNLEDEIRLEAYSNNPLDYSYDYLDDSTLQLLEDEDIF